MSTVGWRPWRPRVARAEAATEGPRAPAPIAGGFRQVRTDLAFAACVLGVFFAVFYRRWPLGEDQGIYHYMAWGMSHGLLPYRDTVNMNWPGIIVVHAVSRAISGASPLGLRLLDTGFLFLLSAATSLTLAAFRVPVPLRLLCLTSYFTSYFLTGFAQTAQRESFALPLVAAGVACCLIYLRTNSDALVRPAFWCGLLSGLGLSVKPTLVPAVLFALALPPALRRSKASLRFVGWFAGGVAVAGGLAVLFVVLCCSPRGFLEWGVRYAFGPYASASWPLRERFRHSVQWLAPMTLCSMPALLALTGVGTFATRVVVRRPWLVQGRWLPTALFGSLTAVLYATVLAQGKTHCIYHFHPVLWGLSLTGVVALRAAYGVRHWPSLRGSVVTLCVVALVVVLTNAAHPVWRTRPDGARLAAVVKDRLAASDELVLLGFAPTLLSAVEHRTPFPFVDSWVLLSCSGRPPCASYARMIGDSLARSVEKPSVKCYVLHRDLTAGGDKGKYSSNKFSEEYVPKEKLVSLGYSRTRHFMPGGAVYDVWLRK
jgi:hypothetical protein